MNLYENRPGRKAAGLVKSSRLSRFLQPLTTKALLMRVSILALFLSVSGLLVAGNGNGQDLDKVLVSVQFKNATLKNALRKIEAQTKLSFAYRTDDISPFGNINYQAKDISVARLLNDLLQATDLGFEQVNSSIVIKRVKRPYGGGGDNAVSSVMEPFDGSLHGTITNEKGEPVPNASVQIVGTSKGTVANSKGEFVISDLKP